MPRDLRPGVVQRRCGRPGARSWTMVDERHSCRYAVDRADTDPMRVADDKMPTPAQTDVTGGVAEILARVAAARAETGRRLRSRR